MVEKFGVFIIRNDKNEPDSWFLPRRKKVNAWQRGTFSPQKKDNLLLIVKVTISSKKFQLYL